MLIIVLRGRDQSRTIQAAGYILISVFDSRHGIRLLLRVMTGAAVDPLTAVPGIGGQQRGQQRGPGVEHPGADRQFDCFQPRRAA